MLSNSVAHYSFQSSSVSFLIVFVNLFASLLSCASSVCLAFQSACYFVLMRLLILCDWNFSDLLICWLRLFIACLFELFHFLVVSGFCSFSSLFLSYFVSWSFPASYLIEGRLSRGLSLVRLVRIFRMFISGFQVEIYQLHWLFLWHNVGSTKPFTWNKCLSA